MNKLSHIDVKGDARMVNVGEKTNTKRRAMAGGSVSMKSETLKLVLGGEHKKGDVLSVARIAGIQAAKNCWFSEVILESLTWKDGKMREVQKRTRIVSNHWRNSRGIFSRIGIKKASFWSRVPVLQQWNVLSKPS